MLGFRDIFFSFSDVQNATSEMPNIFNRNTSANVNVNTTGGNITDSFQVPIDTVSQLSKLFCGRSFSGNPFSSGGAAMRYLLNQITHFHHTSCPKRTPLKGRRKKNSIFHDMVQNSFDTYPPYLVMT